MPVCLWSLVLAAGKGTRLSALTGGLPKQFWSPDGGRTLLDQTVDRLAPLSPRSRRVTIVDRSQAQFVSRMPRRREFGEVVYQPDDRGTAVGVLLGLTAILQEDPSAIVLVTPADHGVRELRLFRRSVERAAAKVQTAASGWGDVVLFGTRPSAPTCDYGWITRANGRTASASTWHSILEFREKPDAEEARRLFEAGAVWNTMVLVGRAESVFAACTRCLPALAETFYAARQMGPAPRQSFLSSRYPTMTRSDFSRDVLSRTTGLVVETWPREMGWSDLGTPERLAAWNARYDTRVAFSR